MILFLLGTIAAQVSPGTIVLEHARGVSYTRTKYEAACREHVIKVTYRNDLGSSVRGRIERFDIDGRAVEGAVEGLQLRAAGRGIDNISIWHCGLDGGEIIIDGAMAHSP